MAKNPTKADIKTATAFVREEDLQDLEALRHDLMERCDRARDDGRVYLMAQYTRLIALVMPEIKRIRDRFDRETLAAIRKEHKMLKGQDDGDDSHEA
jgi:hypothetical protein